jgi:acyl-CoA reductase-like NAD-dependent aldehyde dehydrogenase
MTTITTRPLADVIRRCRQQQQAWAVLPVRRRLAPVRAVRRLLVTEYPGLCAAVARDLGKPLEETLAAEVIPLADACRFLEREAGRLLRPRRVPSGQRPVWLWGQIDTVHRRPRGLVGVIGTWNYPLMLNGLQILQALTAGNGVVWKPSEVAPSSAAALFDLLNRAGFPEGLLQRLEATREAGRELAEADVDHIVFTGGAANGRELAARLGRRLVSSTLELSGCDAMVVLDDADLALAARAARFGVTLNRGQTCVAVRRVLVDRAVYAAFIEALRPLMAGLPPLPLALEGQVRQADQLVREALAEGARLLAEPPPAAGNGVAGLCPVRVVLDARPDMALCREASFAPVCAVLPFDGVAEALRMEAQCPYALGASVFTRSPVRAAQLAAQLRAGMVTVNDVIVPTAHPATPFGGRGASGWGVTQGAEGLREMTVPQVVSEHRGLFAKLRPYYDPPGSTKMTREGTLRGMLEWQHGGTVGRRWRGLLRLLGSMLRKG